jgi:ParB family chromosome partitioning protein
VRDFDDTEVLEVAIIENIQRADLNPIEEAQGYRQLMDRFGHTQEQLATAMGKSRSHIANLMRLLGLPEDVLQMLRDGRLTAGHARALITTDNPSELARRAVAKGLSVREVERLAKSDQSKEGRGGGKRTREKDADTRALEADLSAALGMSVSIDHDQKGGSGKLVIKYNDLEGLDDLDPQAEHRLAEDHARSSLNTAFRTGPSGVGRFQNVCRPAAIRPSSSNVTRRASSMTSR